MLSCADCLQDVREALGGLSGLDDVEDTLKDGSAAKGGKKGKGKGKKRGKKDDGRIRHAPDAKDYADEDDLCDDVQGEQDIQSRLAGATAGCAPT